MCQTIATRAVAEDRAALGRRESPARGVLLYVEGRRRPRTTGCDGHRPRLVAGGDALAEVLEDCLRGVVARGAGDLASGVRAGAAEVEAGERRPVARPAGER